MESSAMTRRRTPSSAVAISSLVLEAKVSVAPAGRFGGQGSQHIRQRGVHIQVDAQQADDPVWSPRMAMVVDFIGSPFLLVLK